jgi:hypothetical protein
MDAQINHYSDSIVLFYHNSRVQQGNETDKSIEWTGSNAG